MKNNLGPLPSAGKKDIQASSVEGVEAPKNHEEREIKTSKGGKEARLPVGKSDFAQVLNESCLAFYHCVLSQPWGSQGESQHCKVSFPGA